VVILAILIVLWAVVLTPTFRRQILQRHIGDSVGAFHRQLGVLRRSSRMTIAPAHRMNESPSGLENLVVPAERPMVPFSPPAWKVAGSPESILPPPREATTYLAEIAPVDEPGATVWSSPDNHLVPLRSNPGQSRRDSRSRQQRRRQIVLAILMLGLLAFSVGAAISPMAFAGPDVAVAIMLGFYMWALSRMRQIAVEPAKGLHFAGTTPRAAAPSTFDDESLPYAEKKLSVSSSGSR
jgi:hypothetical protein